MASTICRVEFIRASGLKALSAHIDRTEKYARAAKAYGDKSYIDPERTSLNFDIIGNKRTSEAVMKLSEGIPYARKAASGDQIVAANFMMTSQPEFFEKRSTEEIRKWAEASVEWIRREYPDSRIASAVVHLDETTPHLHVTIVPIVATRKSPKTGEVIPTAPKINYSRLFSDDPKVLQKARESGRVAEDTKLGRLQTSYAQAMAPFGLVRGQTPAPSPGGVQVRQHETAKKHRQRLDEEERRQQKQAEELAKRQEWQKRSEAALHSWIKAAENINDFELQSVSGFFSSAEKQRRADERVLKNALVAVAQSREIAERAEKWAENASGAKECALREVQRLEKEKEILGANMADLEWAIRAFGHEPDEIIRRAQEHVAQMAEQHEEPDVDDDGLAEEDDAGPRMC